MKNFTTDNNVKTILFIVLQKKTTNFVLFNTIYKLK